MYAGKTDPPSPLLIARLRRLMPIKHQAESVAVKRYLAIKEGFTCDDAFNELIDLAEADAPPADAKTFTPRESVASLDWASLFDAVDTMATRLYQTIKNDIESSGKLMA